MSKTKKKEPTDEEVISKCNSLARMFYSQMGYRVDRGYRFDQAPHPQERGAWNMASAAYYFLLGVDPNELLDDDEDDEQEPPND